MMIPNPTFAAMKRAQDDQKERRAIRHCHDIFIRWDIGSGCGCAECEWQRYLGPWYA